MVIVYNEGSAPNAMCGIVSKNIEIPYVFPPTRQTNDEWHRRQMQSDKHTYLNVFINTHIYL